MSSACREAEVTNGWLLVWGESLILPESTKGTAYIPLLARLQRGQGWLQGLQRTPPVVLAFPAIHQRQIEFRTLFARQ